MTAVQKAQVFLWIPRVWSQFAGLAGTGKPGYACDSTVYSSHRDILSTSKIMLSSQYPNFYILLYLFICLHYGVCAFSTWVCVVVCESLQVDTRGQLVGMIVHFHHVCLKYQNQGFKFGSRQRSSQSCVSAFKMGRTNIKINYKYLEIWGTQKLIL